MRNVGILYIFVLIGTVMISTTSCTKDSPLAPIPVVTTTPTENCPDTVFFSGIIEPIIEQSCSTTGCHDISASGGYNLLGYSNISANVDAILNVINHNSGFTAMPFGGTKLNDSLIQKVDCWKLQGTLNN